MSAPVLDVKGVSLKFGGLAALDNLNLTVGAGEIHGIIGPNGAGKTTSFDVITGVYLPNEGTVTFDGRDITRWRSHKRARAGIGRSFQTVGLAPGLTARNNILGTIEALDRVWSPFPGPKSGGRRAQVDELLAFFGLEEVADTKVTDMPLGTTKLLEVAKVFAGGPKLALLDEPFAGLSVGEAKDRVALISARRRATNAAVVIVEHDVPLLMEVSDSLTVIDAGSVVITAAPEDVMSEPAVREAYMGEVLEETQ